MSVTVHDEFVAAAPVKVRRRRSRIRLRQPEAAYAPVAFMLLFAAGMTGMLATSSFLVGEAASSAGMVAVPAFVSTLVTAFTIGIRIHRYQERYHLGVALRTTYIWAFFGALAPLLQLMPAMSYGEISSITQLLESIVAMGMDYIAGAIIGAIGGIVGGAAALGLCVERVS